MVDCDQSIIQHMNSGGRERCGYCKVGKGFKRWDDWYFFEEFWAHQLKPADYQATIDRGWRRSGHYCYKPLIAESCCLMYTIRCDANEFHLTQSQKRILKTMNAFLHSGIKKKHDIRTSAEAPQPEGNENMEMPCNVHQPGVAPVVAASTEPNQPLRDRQNKAKSKRIRRKFEKLKSLGLTDDEISKKMVEKKKYPVKKTLEDFINDENKDNNAHKLEVRLVRSSPRSPEFVKTYADEYRLFKNYQMSIHNEASHEIRKRSFDNFLIKSPLIAEADMGSFHQQYWLDGQLIAVGVVDILPHCLSSVYFFYDPAFSFLSLGTYGALREAYFVRELCKQEPLRHFYYMGYYIPTCKKMRYKGRFKPSFLLCPETLTWQPFAAWSFKIHQKPTANLTNDPLAGNEPDDYEIPSQLKILYQNDIDLVGNLPALSESMRNDLKELLAVVSPQILSEMIVYFPSH